MSVLDFDSQRCLRRALLNPKITPSGAISSSVFAAPVSGDTLATEKQPPDSSGGGVGAGGGSDGGGGL